MCSLEESVEELKQKINCIMCMEWEDTERAAIITAIDNTFKDHLDKEKASRTFITEALPSKEELKKLVSNGLKCNW